MELEFFDSKDGEKTVKVNGIFLHSPYSPKKEACRFADSQNCPFSPDFIVITEPALSYSVSALKEKFPGVKIAAIRYTNFFDDYNFCLDFVFYYKGIGSIQNQLQAYFTEDKLFSVFFISWKPSEKAFENENTQVWKEIKASLDFAKTLLVTRQFFEKKWLINTVNFIKYSKNFYSINKSNLPLLITASGPSLEENLETIKELENHCLIISLSSALPVLLSNDIIPDFCMTSDGGYWAKEHLKKLKKHNIPLAIANEACCQKSFLQNLPLIPLCYSDGLSKKIYTLSNLPFTQAQRNGTISGTALELALEITSEKIYFFGLDLAESEGFQHSQPNELETAGQVFDNRLNTKEKRLARQTFKNASLEIYKKWFQDKKIPENKIFRVISENFRKNRLGQIKDISPEDFSLRADSIIKSGQVKSREKIFTKINIPSQRNLSKIRDFISTNSENRDWKKALFPLDYTALLHNPANQEISAKLQKENSRLKEKLQKILNDE